MLINTQHNQKLVVLSVFILFSLLHLFIVVLNHYHFKTFAFDYGVYNFAFFDFAHLRISPVPVYVAGTDINFLQDHFSLTLLILSPLYWVLNPLFGTYTLLILQWALIVFGAWATYSLIFLKSQRRMIALASLIFYFILYGRFSSYRSDCNLAIMGSALVPVFLLYFEKRNYIVSSIVFLLLIVNREDFALNMFFLCILQVILNRKDKKQSYFAAILALVSVLAFVIIFKYIIPSLESEQKKFSLFNYEALGNGPAEAVLFVIFHPVDAITLLFTNHSNDPGNDWVKTIFYLVYFISGGFMLVYRPVYLMALVPLIAKKMYNDDSFRWSHEGYYSVELATVLPALVFSVLNTISSTLKQNLLSLLVLVLTAITSMYCLERSTAYYFGSNKFNFLSESFYAPPGNVKILNEFLKQIPEDASVSASGAILPHLAFREKISYFPYLNNADYVCYSPTDGPYPFTQAIFDEQVMQLNKNPNYELVATAENYALYKKISR